jgi:acetolactate synthase-1/2/3 large subunit
MRVADQVVEFISRFCSSKVFLLTGNGAMYINDAMQIHPNIDYLCVRNEAVAPVAASAFSQVSGKIGTVCVTAGPGAANSMPGVVEAWVDGVSILVISGQVPSQEQNNYGRVFDKNQRSFGIAGIPIIDYVEQFTKLAISLNNPLDLESALKTILNALRKGRPGPVWLDIPLDVQSAICEEIDFDSLERELDSDLALINSIPVNNKAIDLVKEAYSKAKKPLFIIGTGAKDSFENASLESWMNKTKSSFALTRPNAHYFPIDHLGNLGVLGVRGRPWSKKILSEVDLIIGLGSRLPSSLVGTNYSYLLSNPEIILINSDEAEIKRHEGRVLNSFPIKVEEIIENIDLTDFIQDRNKFNELGVKAEIFKSGYQVIHKNKKEDELNLYWFCQHLEKYLNKNNILTTDAGSNYYACGQSLSFENAFKEVTSGTFAAMGISVPLSIGCSVATENEHRIVCITGDGSIELNVQELQTISNYKLNIAIFIINNGGYASMRAWQDSYFDSRYIGSTDDTGTKPMNFSKIANAFNLRYEKISGEKSFYSKIEEILNSREPILVEVMCDPDQLLELPMSNDEV